MNISKNQVRNVVGGLSWLSIAFGVGFLVDCRLNDGGSLTECWFTAAGYIGIGGAGRACYSAGFWTPNPDIAQETRNRFAQTDKPES